MANIKATNEIRMKIEDDGAIRVNTDSFEQGEVHRQANEIVKDVITLTGGEHQVVKKKPHDHSHSHVHNTQKA